MVGKKHEEYDPLFREVVGALHWPRDKWPKELLHYTKLTTFQKIASSKSIVLFNPLTMNDRNEMLVAARILATSLGSDEHVIRNMKALDATLPGFPQKLVAYIHDRLGRDTVNTYVFCLSAPDELHPTGPLSMWRAYGGDGMGVSLGFNAAAIAESYEKMRMPVVLYPVRYHTKDEFQAIVRAIVSNVVAVAARAAPLWKVDEQAVLWGVYQAMIIAVATHKHPGFREEQEWRAISFSSFADQDGMLKQEVFPFGAGLRVGLKFSLERYAEAIGLTLSTILTKVTIGPSEQQHTAADAVLNLLNSLEIENPVSRIQLCDTPYRANK